MVFQYNDFKTMGFLRRILKITFFIKNNAKRFPSNFSPNFIAQSVF